jgi:hypothetical protein
MVNLPVHLAQSMLDSGMKVITFDFDRTLCLVSKVQAEMEHIPDPQHIPFEMVVDEFRRLQDEGHSVNILTTRLDKFMPDVHDFLQEFDLHPDNVWNTNMAWKAHFISGLRDREGITVDHHFDDNPEEFQQLLRFTFAGQVDFTLCLSEFGSPARFIDMHQNRIDNMDINKLMRR